jgi:phosphate acetyltransferase
MSDGIYVTGTEPATGKSAVALGLHERLARRVGRLGVFRPVVDTLDGRDPVVDLLRPRAHDPAPYAASLGVTYADVRADEEAALAEIVARFRARAADCDRVVVVGSDFTEAGGSGELALNARIAVNLGIPVLCVSSGRDRRAPQVEAAVDVGVAAVRAAGCEVVAAVANRVAARELGAVQERFRARDGIPTYALPDIGLLTAPDARRRRRGVRRGGHRGRRRAPGPRGARGDRGGDDAANLLDRLLDDVVVITPGDRADVLLGVLAAHASGALPAPAGIVLTGGLRPPLSVLRLIESLPTIPPVVLTSHDTYETATLAGSLLGRITAGARRKIDTALALFEEHVPGQELLDRVAVARSPVVTPLMFEYELLDRARSDRRHIVLPEGDDERVLLAADTLLRRGVVDLTLLGDAEELRAARGGSASTSPGRRSSTPADPELRERLAVEYATRRAHKGVTVDQARDVVADVSYVGTLMVALGMADGMVSGATHTTAQTIRPSLELVKTRPGVSLVSSVFFMCLSDRVLVYGDCAVNVHPTAEQLAEIAISSARTARQFGVEPRVAMLSYSTGASGSGEEVDRVARRPSSCTSARPSSPWRGRSSTTPPSTSAWPGPSCPAARWPGGPPSSSSRPQHGQQHLQGRAAQRGAVAVGPVLQGLRRPVNDLSRGATVQDIVTTVAITAIQAQHPELP